MAVVLTIAARMQTTNFFSFTLQRVEGGLMVLAVDVGSLYIPWENC
jgi:hypothetical protein